MTKLDKATRANPALPNITPEEELEELRKRLLAKIVAGLEVENPKASLLAVAAKFLVEEAKRLEEAARRKLSPSLLDPAELPFQEGEAVSDHTVPLETLPFLEVPLI